MYYSVESHCICGKHAVLRVFSLLLNQSRSVGGGERHRNLHSLNAFLWAQTDRELSGREVFIHTNQNWCGRIFNKMQRDLFCWTEGNFDKVFVTSIRINEASTFLANFSVFWLLIYDINPKRWIFPPKVMNFKEAWLKTSKLLLAWTHSWNFSYALHAFYEFMGVLHSLPLPFPSLL